MIIEYNDDISKIVLSCAITDISGVQLADMLRSKYKIEPEAVSQNYVLLMMTIGDDDLAFDLLKKAITEIDEGLSCSPAVPVRKPPTFDGESVISISDYSELTDIERCVGKRSNEFIYAYPPDLPILSPN